MYGFWVGGYFVLRLFVAKVTAGITHHEGFLSMSLWKYVAVFAQLNTWYLSKLIYPDNILFMWNTNAIDHVAARNLGFWSAAGAIGGLLFYWRRDIKSFALLLFLIGLVPAGLGIFTMPSIGFIIEPNWFIFPSVGYFLLVAVYLSGLREYWDKKIWVFVILCLAAFFYLKSIALASVFKNDRHYCEYWMKLRPQNPIPRMRFALACLKEKEYERALEYFKEIMRESSYERECILYGMGQMYIERGDLPLAKQYLAEAQAINPVFDSIDNALGTIAVKEGDTKIAKSYFEEALRKNPAAVISMLNVADLLLQEGQVQDAIAWYERALQTDPAHSEKENTLGKLSALYVQINRNKEAEILLKKAIKEFPKNKEMYLLYGISLGNQDRFNEAVSVWERGAKLDPKDARFSEYIAKARKLLAK